MIPSGNKSQKLSLLFNYVIIWMKTQQVTPKGYKKVTVNGYLGTTLSLN